MLKDNRYSVLLVIILLVAFALRMWGIGHDLPYIYHPDEPSYIAISQNIFRMGDLNPHFFHYPTLFFYLNALAYIPFYLVGKVLGVFASPADILTPVSLAMGVAKSPMPTTVLGGRLITLLFGVGTVALTYLIGKRLSNRAEVGLFAALLVAVAPSNVYHSRFVTPDTFVVFFAAAAFYAAVLVYQQGKTWQYCLAGICVGLTASSKYNGGMIVLALLLAHFLRHGRGALKERNLYLGLFLCGVGFLATTPFALLDLSNFLEDLAFERQHYSTGHTGMEGDSLRWYLSYMWNTAGLIYLAAFLEGLRAVFARDKGILLLAAFPVVYFIFISSFVVRNDKTFLPLTPFLFLLTASFFAHLLSKAGAWRSTPRYKPTVAMLAGLAIIGVAQPFSTTIGNSIRFATVDSRETARVWIGNNLPADAKIAIEPYVPYLEPAQFSVHQTAQMIANEPAWYLEQGFEYLIFSEGMYGRYFREPDRYQMQVAQYERLFQRFDLVKLFTDGDYEVRIYRVQ